MKAVSEGLRVFDFGVWAWVYGFHNLFKPYLKDEAERLKEQRY